MEKCINKPATELEEIIKDGLYGNKDIHEIEKQLNEYERIHADDIYELEIQASNQNRIDLEFKAGSWAVNHLLGSEIHVATEIHGQNPVGDSLSHKIEPNQNFNITIKEGRES